MTTSQQPLSLHKWKSYPVSLCYYEPMFKIFGFHLHVSSLPSCSCFLCCDWLRLAAGSESGRSSPYYGQEGRSSTPTTNQPPRHFHVPGRTPHLPVSFVTAWGSFYQLLFTNANHPERSLYVLWEYGALKMWLSRIFIPHIIALTYTSPHTASLPTSTFLPSPQTTHNSVLFIPPRFTSPSALSLLSHRGP